jgi:hypothetical protein
MRPSAKPVRKCHACPLNLGERCWHYAVPREQWRHGARCPGIDDAVLHAAFRQWLKRPQVKTRKELRQEQFTAQRPKTFPHSRRPKRGDRH